MQNRFHLELHRSGNVVYAPTPPNSLPEDARASSRPSQGSNSIRHKSEKRRKDSVKTHERMQNEDTSEREGSNSVGSFTDMPVMTHSDSDETSTKSDVGGNRAEQYSTSRHEPLQKQSTSPIFYKK